MIREKAAPFGDRILPSLEEALEEHKGCIQLMAVYTIGNLDSPRVDSILTEVAKGNGAPLGEEGAISREYIQGAALVTLGQRGNKEAYPLMIKAAGSDNGTLRVKAVEALGYVGDESTLPFLQDMLKDPYTVAGKRVVAVAASRSLKLITGRDYPIE